MCNCTNYPNCCCGSSIKNCCEVCNCLEIISDNETVKSSKEGCKIDLTIDFSSIDKLLNIKSGQCISFTKEYIDGVITITPFLNWQCMALMLCPLCNTENCVATGIVGTPVLPDGQVGIPYNYSFNLSGTAPFFLRSGTSIPSWLAVNIVGSTATITGTPPNGSDGSYTIILQFDNCDNIHPDGFTQDIIIAP